MRIEKLNLRVKSHTLAKSEDFNRATEKVDEIIGELNGLEPAESMFADGTVSDANIGGLSVGTDVSGKTALDVIGMIISPEYAPVWTDGYASVSVGRTVYAVGERIPSVGSFVSSYVSPKAVYGDVVTECTARSLSVTKDERLASFGSVVGDAGSTIVTLEVELMASEGQVKTSKGRPTNRTSDVPGVLAGNAGINSMVTSDFRIGASVLKASVTLHYVYPVFATTSSVGSLIAQPAQTSQVYTLAMPSETADDKHSFAVPYGSSVSVKLLNTLSGKYEDYSLSNFYESSYDVRLADGSTRVYRRYTRRDGTNGTTTFQVTVRS